MCFFSKIEYCIDITRSGYLVLSPIESALRITNNNILTLKDSVNVHSIRYNGLDQYHYKQSFMRRLKDITHLETDL